MHATDNQEIEWLKGKLADYQQRLANVETEAAIEILAPSMWEEYRQDLSGRQKVYQDAIASIESRLPCEALLNVVDSELYTALLQRYPKITRHTEVVRVPSDLVRGGEFYWQPIKPINVLNSPIPSFIERESFKIQFTQFAKNGRDVGAFAYLESHDIVFVVVHYRPTP